MKKITFGTPEPLVPTRFSDKFSFEETPVSFDETKIVFKKIRGGVLLEYPAEPDTHFYGCGLQIWEFDHAGHKLTLRTNADPKTPNGESHAPVPFFVTNKGYGVFLDTARYAEIYFGAQKPGDSFAPDENYTVKLSTDDLYAARMAAENTYVSIFIPHTEGVDLYVIEGESIRDIVAQYNMASGGGPEVPSWALGVLYRCNGRYSAEQILEVAGYMRENEIPCDIIGVEPGWQTHAYACTYVWDPEKFPDPAGFVARLKEMNFHVNLWEHAYVYPTCPIYDELKPLSGDYTTFRGLVPDFALPEARRIFADFQKNLTRIGVDGFKADECDGSDNTGGWSFPNHASFPSGLDGEQYHNLFGVLYAKAMHEALDYQPTLSEIRSMGALAAPYPFVLYSDLYDHRGFVRALVNSGFSGLLWAPEMRGVGSKKELIRRLQTVVFSPQCLINAWSCPKIPWVDFDCVEEVREILTLREKLIPKIKSAFDRYRATGVPPIRALVMEHTDDPETYAIDDEYYFTDDLLVAPIIGTESDTREVYLPAGKWVDFFTGESVPAGRFTVTTGNIPVYKKIG
ncbi:MAG: glycoside hydrolase [Clostridia bacterium]|nr:glycoside hydrolase [Clostridia bacterium]